MKTIEEIKNYRYGFKGINKRDESKCAAEVWGGHWHCFQCSRKPGHGLGGLFCKQHAKKHPEQPSRDTGVGK